MRNDVRIENNVRPNVEVEIKRFYPPFDITSWCTQCNAEIKQEGDQYLSYPTLGKPEEVYFYCDECDNEWGVEIVLTLTADPAPEGGARE